MNSIDSQTPKINFVNVRPLFNLDGSFAPIMTVFMRYDGSGAYDFKLHFGFQIKFDHHLVYRGTALANRFGD
jgi:hypothetical protein